MSVVPESMIVSNPETTVFPPDRTLAPVACQNPDLTTGWNSMEPVYSFEFVPPRNSSDPEVASLKANSLLGTAFWENAFWKKGVYSLV